MMQRQFAADSRSPTIANTPSRIVPLRSTEHAPNMFLSHLVDSLRMQIQDDRAKQDELFDSVIDLINDIKFIRNSQDDCLKSIKQALDAQSRNRNVNQGRDGTERSRAEECGVIDDVHAFRAISEAEDSVFGNVQDYNRHTIASNERRRTNDGAADVPREHETRSSVSYGADHVLTAVGDMINGEDTDRDTVREHTQTGTATDSRLPTPVTPGTSRQIIGGGRAENTLEVLDLTARSPFTNSPEPAAGSNIAPTAMMLAPLTPASRGKRKRTKRGWEPTLSAERPARRARDMATLKTEKLLKFANQSARAQSRARRDGEEDPFVTCGDCRQPGCRRCDERREQAAHSTLMRIQ